MDQNPKSEVTEGPGAEDASKTDLPTGDFMSSASSLGTATASSAAGADPTTFLAPPQLPDEIGRLARYRVLKELGAGGMGMVFLAEDMDLQRPVALKVMLPEVAAKQEAGKRFLREARTVASIKNDHVVTIHQVGEFAGIPYLAMEFLQGSSLSDWLKTQRKLSVSEIVRIGKEAALGLAAAHEKGLVHRDIKPANIWLEAPHQRVKILDFGLARQQSAGDNLTHSGAILGTPAYMAPEQAQGKAVDGRCDLFSLGCVLYRMATGEQAFQGETVMAILMALATIDPAPASTVRKDLPPALDKLIERLLSKDPANRPASAREVADELARIDRQIDGTILASANIELPWPVSLPATVARTPTNKSRGKGLYIGAMALAAAAVLTWQFVLPMLNNTETKQVSPKEVVEKDLPKENQAPSPKVETPKLELMPKEPLLASLDKLSPDEIPASEKFSWQPKELVAVIGQHAGRQWSAVNAITVSWDGKWIASTGDFGELHFWDAATLEHKFFLPRIASNGGVSAVFLPGGFQVIFADYYGGLHLVDGSAGLPRLLPWPPKTKASDIKSAARYGLQCTSDGKTLVGTHGKSIWVWELAGGAPRLRYTHYLSHDPPSGGIATSLAAKAGLMAHVDGNRTVLSDPTQLAFKEMAALEHQETPRSVRLTEDASKMVVGFERKFAIFHWDGMKWDQGEEFSSQLSPYLQLSPDGKRMVLGIDIPEVWNLEGKRPEMIGKLQLFPPGSGKVHYKFAFTPDSKKLVAGGGDGLMHLWDIENKPRRMDNADAKLVPLRSSNASSQLEWITSTGLFGFVNREYQSFTWDLTDRRPRPWAGITWDTAAKTVVGMSPKGNFLVVWNPVLTKLEILKRAAMNWEVLATVPAKGFFMDRPVMFDDAESKLYYVLNERLHCWDLQSPIREKPMSEIRLARYQHIVLSPNGRWLSVVKENTPYSLSLWDLQNDPPKLVMELKGRVRKQAFSPNGEWFAWASESGGYSVDIWDLRGEKPQEVMKHYPKGGSINGLSFSPDNKTLAVADNSALSTLEVPEMKVKYRWESPGALLDVVYCPDGRHVITHNGNGTFYVLRLAPRPATNRTGEPTGR
jgi:serine/threonine protein kinase/WD40 repeat protein